MKGRGDALPARNDMVTFSIIIPTFNSARTMRACLESLSVQTFTDFEVVIQDGLSTDDTAAIIAEWHRAHPGLAVRVDSRKDRGIYDAMNKALLRAKGEWMYFLGSDDQLCEPDTLHKVADAFADDVDVVYGDVMTAQINGRYAGRFCMQQIARCNICHQSLFVRRRLFDSFGLFDLRYRVLADWEHNMRWFLSPRVRVKYVDQVIAVFAAGGLSSTGKDLVFGEEMMLLYVRHGRQSLPFRMKARLVLEELKRAARARDWRHFLRGLRACPAVLARQQPLPR
jgi:glycosyltransferase involved in cell wall biosynthesis